jgi:DNA modification methylase
MPDATDDEMQYQSNVDRLSETTLHDWYRMVYAYSDQIIYDLVDEWGVTGDDLLLDPFAGTGTTNVAAKVIGVDSIGTDASPIAVLASRAKTTWDVDLEGFRDRSSELLRTVEPAFEAISAEGHTTLASFGDDDRAAVDLSTYDLSKPEKTPKGWLSEKPRKKMLVLRHHVDDLPDDEITDLLRLAMCAILPESVANVGFGPEAYRTSEQEDVDVYAHFGDKIDKMATDLEKIQTGIAEGDVDPGRTEIVDADARVVGDTLGERSTLLADHGTVDYVITSPPYPAEHDYTRNQRLELVWLGVLEDNADLQRIKKRNIRSNTKNIYVDDDDGDRLNIRENDRIDAIVARMEGIIEEEDVQHGFGQYYPRVVEEYFAGMQRHLQQVYDVMSPGGKAGYVVADSGSYWQVDIPTGTILGELAENRVGFDELGIELWRNLNATTGAKDQREEILILEKPA